MGLKNNNTLNFGNIQKVFELHKIMLRKKHYAGCTL